MKKGYPFLIFVAAALFTLAYQARLSSSYENVTPLVLTSAMSTSPSASVSQQPSLEVAPTKVMTVSRYPASQAQPLEIEEVEVQN